MAGDRIPTGGYMLGFPRIDSGGTTSYAVATQNSDSAGNAAPAGSSTDPFYYKGASYTFLSDQQIVEPSTSTALTVPASATLAVVQNNGTVACRWRIGNAPTATLGQTIAAGGSLTLDVRNVDIVAARFIRSAAGVTLDVNYYA